MRQNVSREGYARSNAQCILEAPSRLRRDGHPSGRGGNSMENIKRDSIFSAAVALLAFAAVALAFLPMARAQTVGAYGSVMGNSAGAGPSAPHAHLPSLPGTSPETNSSRTRTTQIREEHSSPAY